MKSKSYVRSLVLGGVLTLLLAACGNGPATEPVEPVEPTEPRHIVISEIYYHSITDDDSDDFIELFNAHDQPVALTGWCIKGVGYCFTDTTVLESQQYVVVYGKDFSGRLGNKGEQIRIVDAQENIRDEIDYSDSNPWPQSADGDGDALHRKNLLLSANSVDNWVAAPPTPGEMFDEAKKLSTRDNSDVVMTEIHYNPVDGNPAAEFIELQNLTSQALTLSGWCIDGASICLTQQDVIEPLGSFVVSGLTGALSLSNSGQALRLVDSDGSVHDFVRYANNDPWPALADGFGHSLHRRSTSLQGNSPANWVSGDPSPGKNSAIDIAEPLQFFEKVTHTRSPAPGTPVAVSAFNGNLTTATLHYRYGFDEEQSAVMTKNTEGKWTGSIPGSGDGTLIRFRLTGELGDAVAQWPRQGDGSQYAGTVVLSPSASPLPRLQWFMDARSFSDLRNKRKLVGDTGFPAVFAFNGEVIDNALIRVKGQESRGREKNKYKVTLPAGRLWDMGGSLESPVNEFGLHSMLTDKSYSRELLTYDLQKVSGGMAQQVFPLRLELNNEFYGLYLYHEQPDGRWRKKYGFDGNSVAIKGERISTLRRSHTMRTDQKMDIDYRRQTQRYNFHHNEMRWLIDQVNQDESKVIDFIYRHVDVPQVVNALAVQRVAQHVELEHKNWLMFFDPRDEKWRFQAIDHDLNFGKKWTAGCKSRCDEVFANPYMTYMQANRFTRSFVIIPEFRELVDRRTRTLVDAFLKEGIIESRLTELHAAMEIDAKLDKAKWGQYGIRQTLKEAQDLIVEGYVKPKRGFYLRLDEKYLPLSQKNVISYVLDDSQAGVVRISNSDTTSIDLSGISLPSIEGRVASGTVLWPGQSVVVTSRRIPRGEVQNKDLHVAMAPVAND